MGRPLRLFEPQGIYFITGRCLQARLLMRPCRETNDIIGGVLAKALENFDIKLFSFVFMSNHFHMLVQSPNGHIPAFMQYVRGNIAKQVGKNVGWRGKFWDRRYDAEPVLDDDALLRRLRYILSHGVKEGLVSKSNEWPGLHCVRELTHGIVRTFAWQGDTKTNKRLRPVFVSPIPCWDGLSQQQHKEMYRNLVSSINAERSKPILGIRSILRQPPHNFPEKSSRSPRPLCHTTSNTLRAEYEERYRAFAAAYRIASAAYRQGDTTVEFPLYSYRPPPWVAMVKRKEAA